MACDGLNSINRGNYRTEGHRLQSNRLVAKMTFKAYVVSFQAFRGPGNKGYWLKELAIASVHSDESYHWLIEPPVSYTTLNVDQLRNINYVTDKVHGINWFSGSYSEESVLEAMRDIVKDAKMVYIKGSERVLYIAERLRDFPNIVVTDLDNLREAKYAKKDVTVECPLESEKHRSLRCAYEQVIRYRNVLRKVVYPVGIKEPVGGLVKPKIVKKLSVVNRPRIKKVLFRTTCKYVYKGYL